MKNFVLITFLFVSCTNRQSANYDELIRRHEAEKGRKIDLASVKVYKEIDLPKDEKMIYFAAVADASIAIIDSMKVGVTGDGILIEMR